MEHLWVGFAFNAAAFVICLVYGLLRRSDRPYQGGFRWFLAWIGVSLIGVWVADHRNPPHQEAHLGGWFSGHGGLIAAIAGATTYDYSLVSSPKTVGPVVLNQDGSLAATMSQGDLIVWDVASATPVCTSEYIGYTQYALFWVGDTVFVAETSRESKTREPVTLRRYPISAMKDGGCGVSKATKIPSVLAMCGTQRSFLVAQYEETRVIVRPVQRDLVEAASATGGFDIEAPPIIQVEGLHLDKAQWQFSPGCEWLFWTTTTQDSFGSEVTGSRFSGHRIAVEAGRVAEPFSTTLTHGPYTRISSVAFSRDGGHFAAVARGAVTTYDLGTGKRQERTRFIANEGQYGVFPKVLVGSGGAYIVTSGRSTGVNAEPGVIAVLDPMTLETRYELDGHGDAINAVALSADGRRLITGSRDQTARVWRLPGMGDVTGEEKR